LLGHLIKWGAHPSKEYSGVFTPEETNNLFSKLGVPHTSESIHRTAADAQYPPEDPFDVPLDSLDDYHDNYNKALSSLKYGREVPVHEMHPDLAYTRLGAHLKEAARGDDDIAHLSAAALTNEGKVDQPLELMPLHALRDAVQENPNHPLSQDFNWEKLPEKVDIDNKLRKHIREQKGPLVEVPDVINDLNRSGGASTRLLSQFNKHTGTSLSSEEVLKSLHRLNDQEFHKLSVEQQGLARSSGWENAPETAHTNWLMPINDPEHHQRY
jgi:hypothetical protein